MIVIQFETMKNHFFCEIGLKMNLVPIVILTYNMGLNDSQVAMQSSKGVWLVGNHLSGQNADL